MKWKSILMLIIVTFIIFTSSCGEDVPVIDIGDGPYEPVIDPANFAEKIENQYLPLTLGTVLIYEGDTDDGKERVEFTVTNETKEILGVACIVVHDQVSVDGKLVEDTYDWYAQDKDGNVWYFGEDSTDYKDGKVIGTAGSWEAGVDGAKPGIIMEASPKVGNAYRQEYYKGEAEDLAEVMSLNDSVSIAYGSFENCLKTKEWTPPEPDVVEHKFYAPGIGVVLEVMVKGGDERLELIEAKTQ